MAYSAMQRSVVQNSYKYPPNMAEDCYGARMNPNPIYFYDIAPQHMQPNVNVEQEQQRILDEVKCQEQQRIHRRERRQQSNPNTSTAINPCACGKCDTSNNNNKQYKSCNPSKYDRKVKVIIKEIPVPVVYIPSNPCENEWVKYPYLLNSYNRNINW
jgi:hypothetical protein